MTVSDMDNNLQNEEKRRWGIYILFLALGVLTGIPDGFFPTAINYWMFKFRDLEDLNYALNNENRTNLQVNFISNYSIVSQCGMGIFLLLTVFFLKIRFSLMDRIVSSLSVTITLFTVTSVFTTLNTDQWQELFYISTLVISFVINCFTAVLLVSIFELGMQFPAIYLAALLTGQSVCDVLASIVQICTLAVKTSPDLEGLFYFSFGGLFVLGATGAFFVALRNSNFFNKHFSKEIIKANSTPKIKILYVVKKYKYYMLTMIIVVGSTIMVHPGVTSLVLPKNNDEGNAWNDTFFVPTITFLLYNVCVCIGRETANVVKRPRNEYVMLGLAIIRACFMPFVLLCNAQPRYHFKVVFEDDYVYIIYIVISSFTFGYFINLFAVRIPMVADNPEERKAAMIMLVVLIAVSAGIFSFISAALVKVI